MSVVGDGGLLGNGGGGSTATTYSPAMTQFDGSTGYYEKTGVTTSGNTVTGVVRFKRGDFTGDVHEVLMHVHKTWARLSLLVISSDHSSLTNRHGKLQMDVVNSSGTLLCKIISTNSVLDDEEHIVLFSFNADTGSATFIIDGVSADDTGNPDRVAPTTGTLESGTGFAVRVGDDNTFTHKFGGQLGFIGYRDAYLTNWSDFSTTSGPKELDTIEWTEWNGGTAQSPMMTFDGSTGYYNKTNITTSGNKVTAVVRFTASPLAGSARRIASATSTYGRFYITIRASDDVTPSEQNVVFVQSSSTTGTMLCKLFAGNDLLDGNPHTLLYALDADTGTATFIVDGVNADDTGQANRVAPTTGTLEQGATTSFGVGADASGVVPFDGDVGFFGAIDSYLTNWSDFMAADGTPKEIDEISWAQWGGQPLFWNKGGLMTDNKGSAGAMTANGTITGPIGGWPLFWNTYGQMSNNKGSAGDMTENGVVVVA
jgi:hypothetical protein